MLGEVRLALRGLHAFEEPVQRNAPILSEDTLPRVSQLVNWTVTRFEF